MLLNNISMVCDYRTALERLERMSDKLPFYEALRKQLVKSSLGSCEEDMAKVVIEWLFKDQNNHNGEDKKFNG